MLEKVKIIAIKAKDIAFDLGHKAKGVTESESFKKGVSLLKTKWENIKENRAQNKADIEALANEEDLNEKTIETGTVPTEEKVKKTVRKTPVKKARSTVKKIPQNKNNTTENQKSEKTPEINKRGESKI